MSETQDPSRDDVEQLVAQVLDADDPSAALETVCAEHPALAARVRGSVDALGRLGMVADPRAAAAAAAEGDAPPAIAGFDLRAKLGEGGMGVVYRAWDRALGREVALKVLRPEFLHFEGSRQRFRREVEAIARLSHPGIVAVHHADVATAVPFFTMEYVDGASLAAVLTGLRGRPHGTLRGADLLCFDATGSGSSSHAMRLAESWTDASVEVARMVAEALQHAHDQGVFHRDVKPSNVLLDRHGRARLLDFGLARVDDAQQLTRSGAMLGSLPYLPPEIVAGTCAEPGAPQDVYALGVTLYEMLTLQPAFLAASPEETRRRIAQGDVAWPRQRNRAVDRECEVVCLKAMDLDPARRYPTARAFADDLDALLGRRPIAGRRAGVLLRSRRFVQRHPTRSVALALGALLLVASLVAAGAALRARDVERGARTGLVDAHLRFVFDFAQGLRRIPGNTEVRAELLGRAERELARFEDDTDLTPARLAAIGDAYLALAGALGDWTKSNLGEREAARARYDHVLDEIVPRVEKLDPRAAAILRARAALALGSALLLEGERERSFALQRGAAEALLPHLADDPGTDAELALERSYLTLRSQCAAAVGSMGRHRDALVEFEAVHERLAQRARQRPGDAEAARKAARAHASVARALYMLGEHARAADAYTPYVDLLALRLADAPDDARRQFERLRGAISYPEILIQAGRLDAAEAECRRLLALCEQMIAADPDDQSLPDLLLHVRYGLGWALQARAEAAIAAGAAVADPAVHEDLRAALAALQQARAEMEALRAAGKLNPNVKTDRVDGRIAAVQELLGRGP